MITILLKTGVKQEIPVLHKSNLFAVHYVSKTFYPKGGGAGEYYLEKTELTLSHIELGLRLPVTFSVDKLEAAKELATWLDEHFQNSIEFIPTFKAKAESIQAESFGR